jgi:hypothetical protein
MQGTLLMNSRVSFAQSFSVLVITPRGAAFGLPAVHAASDQVICTLQDAINSKAAVQHDSPDTLLMANVSGPEAGKADQHPSVLAETRKTGLSADEEGNLIIEKSAA